MSKTFMFLNLAGHAVSFYLDATGRKDLQKLANRFNFWGMIHIMWLIVFARLHAPGQAINCKSLLRQRANASKGSQRNSTYCNRQNGIPQIILLVGRLSQSNDKPTLWFSNRDDSLHGFCASKARECELVSSAGTGTMVVLLSLSTFAFFACILTAYRRPLKEAFFPTMNPVVPSSGAPRLFLEGGKGPEDE